MRQDQSLPARRSVRLKHFDYSQPGIYFVTICTNERECLFGDVRDGSMHLNAIGRVASESWAQIPLHFPVLDLGPYVVMPNHLHGILVLYKRARHAVPLQDLGAQTEGFGKPVSGSLGTIVRSFKATVSKHVRAVGMFTRKPFWQRSFYERVIRTGDEFHHASRYIFENPQNWQADEDNPAWFRKFA